MTFSKKDLYDFDPKSSSRAFATPRSWSFVSELLVDDDTDESTLTERSTQAIDEIVSTIVDPQAKVVVVCHSSSDGPLDQRLPLSEERASVLADALEAAMNRNANSIDRVGLGDTSPLSGIDGSTVAGLALNRRCEVFVELKK